MTGQVQPALCRPDIADLSAAHFSLGASAEKFWSRRFDATALLCWHVRRLFELLFPFWRQPISPHQPRSPYPASNLDPILGKLVMDPLCTVALRGCAE